MIVCETSHYYEQQKASNPNKHKMPWHPVTKGEMKAFVGILILMGVIKLPRFEMYWSSDRLIHQEGITEVMPRTRFLQIWRYFHLADNSKVAALGTDGYDKIYRVRTFLSLISRIM